MSRAFKTKQSLTLTDLLGMDESVPLQLELSLQFQRYLRLVHVSFGSWVRVNSFSIQRISFATFLFVRRGVQLHEDQTLGECRLPTDSQLMLVDAEASPWRVCLPFGTISVGRCVKVKFAGMVPRRHCTSLDVLAACECRKSCHAPFMCPKHDVFCVISATLGTRPIPLFFKLCRVTPPTKYAGNGGSSGSPAICPARSLMPPLPKRKHERRNKWHVPKERRKKNRLRPSRCQP